MSVQIVAQPAMLRKEHLIVGCWRKHQAAVDSQILGEEDAIRLDAVGPGLVQRPDDQVRVRLAHVGQKPAVQRVVHQRGLEAMLAPSGLVGPIDHEQDVLLTPT